MIEAVFLFVAYMNGSQTITQMPDMQTCRAVERVVRQSAGTNFNVANAVKVEPTHTRCIATKDGQLVSVSSAAPGKE